MKLEGFHDATAILASGVYVLVAKGTVVYVGKSKCMLVRTYTHRQMQAAKGRKDRPFWISTPGIRYDELHVCPCPLDRLDALEREMIHRYQPRYNKKLLDDSAVTTPTPLRIGNLTLTLNKPVHPHVERRV